MSDKELMMNFQYCAPTKIFFGRRAEEKVGRITSDFGFRKILLVYGNGSAVRSGLIARVKKSLDENSVEYLELSGIVANPRLSKVYEGISMCRKNSIRMILAVGGGSVIDTAKAIGYGSAGEYDVWDYYTGARIPDATLPVASIPTIAASGSEMSNSSVIMKDDTCEKRGINFEISRCIFSILDPELTFTLPTYQTSCGCVDICMHSIERYFSASGNLEITDRINETLIRTVMRDSKILMDRPDDYDARASVMWAGSLSHNGLTGLGGDGGGLGAASDRA
jgi:alcohol dehydrogenase YqhD (iron-dependent ADH family)